MTVEFAAQLSSDAYLTEYKIKKKYQKIYNVKTYDMDGLFFYTLEDRTIQIVAFRGTHNITNWQTNFTVVEREFDEVDGALVHGGFYEISLRAAKIVSLQKNKPVFLTGHSLGGATALLSAATLYNYGYDASVITFGVPPVGNEEFAAALRHLSHKRFEHIFDPVPKANKKSVMTLQSILKNFNFSSSKYENINNLVEYLKTVPYNFVQHGERHILSNILPMENILSLDLLIQPIRYHAMDSYILGVQKTKDANSF